MIGFCGQKIAVVAGRPMQTVSSTRRCARLMVEPDTNPLHSLHSSANYCNTLMYFCITNNKVKTALTVLSSLITKCDHTKAT